MDWNSSIELTPETENEPLTRVVWWDESRLDDAGVFTFTFNRCAVAKDNSNYALINTDTSEKVVLWLVHHPSAKFPDAVTDGEKVFRAFVKAQGEAMSPEQIVTAMNENGGTLVYDKNQRVMKWKVEQIAE